MDRSGVEWSGGGVSLGELNWRRREKKKRRKSEKGKRLPNKTISTTLSQPALFMYSNMRANKHVLVNIV